MPTIPILPYQIEELVELVENVKYRIEAQSFPENRTEYGRTAFDYMQNRGQEISLSQVLRERRETREDLRGPVDEMLFGYIARSGVTPGDFVSMMNTDMATGMTTRERVATIGAYRAAYEEAQEGHGLPPEAQLRAIRERQIPPNIRNGGERVRRD